MASVPLTTYQTTYAQAIANGLPSGAAQLAAQTAMQSVLNQQNSRPPTIATSFQPVQSGRTTDRGPTMPPKRSR